MKERERGMAESRKRIAQEENKAMVATEALIYFHVWRSYFHLFFLKLFKALPFHSGKDHKPSVLSSLSNVGSSLSTVERSLKLWPHPSIVGKPWTNDNSETSVFSLVKTCVTGSFIGEN